MDDWVKMKGVGRLVMSLIGDEGTATQLLRYPDGGWGISRDGRICALWEPHEQDLCLAAFLAHVTPSDSLTHIIVCRDALNSAKTWN